MKDTFPLLAIATALAAISCTAPDSSPEAGPELEPGGPPLPVEAAPWTRDFMNEALLVAQSVTIEGPPGLLDHVAVSQNPEIHAYGVRTTARGLLLESRALSNAKGEPIRGQLDGLAIAAVQRITVLENPGASEVVIRASGDVYWTEIESGREQRGESLELKGRRPR